MNVKERSRSFRPGACQKCGGDAFLDRSEEPEWRCLQCGRPLMSYSPLRAEAFSLRTDAILKARTKELLTAERIEAGMIGDGKARRATSALTASRLDEQRS